MSSAKTVRVVTMGYLASGEFIEQGYMDVPCKKEVEIAGYPAQVHRPPNGGKEWVVSSYGTKWVGYGSNTIQKAIDDAHERARIFAKQLAEAMDRAKATLAIAEANGPVTIERQ